MMPCKFRLDNDRCDFGFLEADIEAGSRCILHASPDDPTSWSTARTAHVQQALDWVIERSAESKRPLRFVGVVLPNGVSFGARELPELIIRHSQFGGGKHFAEAVFPKSVRIEQCIFRGETSFAGAQFKGKFELDASVASALDFSRARFDSSVSIKIGTQGGKSVVSFNEIRCEGGFTLVPAGNLTAIIEFKNAVFGGRFRAEGEYSRGMDCSGARFASEMSFAGVIDKKFTAEDCHFQSEVDFRGAVFRGAAIFSKSRFEKRAQFACGFVGPALFEDCVFEKQADFSASGGAEEKSAGPSAIGFQGTRFRGPAWFNNRTFASTTNFAACEFAEAPEFHGAKLHQDTRLPPIDAFKNRESEDAAAAYRTLRQAMEANNARREEAMFYALEQKTLRRIPGKQSRWENIASALYDGVSAYGVNFWRPIAWLLATMLLFGVSYALWISWPIAPSSSFDGERLANGLVFSLQQVVNPFWIWRASDLPWPTEWPNALKVVATVESLLTTALFALSLLALRWRFKRE